MEALLEEKFELEETVKEQVGLCLWKAKELSLEVKWQLEELSLLGRCSSQYQ